MPPRARALNHQIKKPVAIWNIPATSARRHCDGPSGIAFLFFCLFGRETIQQYPAYCCMLDMRCISSIVSYCFVQEFTDFFGPTVPPIGTLGQTFPNTATVSILQRPLTRLLRYTHLNFPSGPNTGDLPWMVAKSDKPPKGWLKHVETIYSK